MLEPTEPGHAVAALERRVAREISNCPTLVSGCDAQLNYLLDIGRRLERTSAELEVGEPIPTSGQPL